MFSIVSVTGAFKRRASGSQQHEAGTRKSNVTFQIETKVGETLCQGSQTLSYRLLSSPFNTT